MSSASVLQASPDAAPAEQAVAAVLQPLARLMIDQGVQLAQVSEMLKAVLVQESVARYGLDEREVSDTRVALLTGVHRKDRLATTLFGGQSIPGTGYRLSLRHQATRRGAV